MANKAILEKAINATLNIVIFYFHIHRLYKILHTLINKKNTSIHLLENNINKEKTQKWSAGYTRVIFRLTITWRNLINK